MRPNPVRAPLSLEILQEREALNQALLAATSALAEGDNAGSILQHACDALYGASPHILTVWVSLETEAGMAAHPVYAAGAADVIALLTRADDADDVFRAIESRNLIRRSEQVVCFVLPAPFPKAGRGCIAVHADRGDYFDEVGIGPFAAFAELCATVLKQARHREHLRQRAEFDELTGLFNRAGIRTVVEHEHAMAERSSGGYALVLLDLDHFKAVNDNYGHAAGDQVLRAVAERAKAALRHGDWLARWGGEEFLALLPGADAEEAVAIAERVRERVSRFPVRLEDQELRVSLSAGVACHPLDATDIPALIEAADAALYEAKRQGRNRVRHFPRQRGRLNLAREIEEGLTNDRFRAAYQRIIELDTGNQVAHETLARLLRPRGRLLEARHFVRIASQRHRIHHIDYRMIRHTLERCLADLEQGRLSRYVVNVSADLLRHEELLERLIGTAAEIGARCHDAGLPPPIIVAIQEQDFLDAREARALLKPVLELDLPLALDDFGCGNSSFQYLAELPVSLLKIERRLIGQTRSDARAKGIVRGIRETGAALGAITLAEGVEDAPTAALLRDMGVQWAQGHHFGRPRLAVSL